MPKTTTLSSPLNVTWNAQHLSSSFLNLQQIVTRKVEGAKTNTPPKIQHLYLPPNHQHSTPLKRSPSMIGENRQWVTDEPVEFETARKLLLILEQFIEYALN
jgi:hypothetical protein